mgnify:CR=1 FL=1
MASNRSICWSATCPAPKRSLWLLRSQKHLTAATRLMSFPATGPRSKSRRADHRRCQPAGARVLAESDDSATGAGGAALAEQTPFLTEPFDGAIPINNITFRHLQRTCQFPTNSMTSSRSRQSEYQRVVLRHQIARLPLQQQLLLKAETHRSSPWPWVTGFHYLPQPGQTHGSGVPPSVAMTQLQALLPSSGCQIVPIRGSRQTRRQS